MNVRDNLPDFFGDKALPGLAKGKKHMKMKMKPADKRADKPKGKAMPPKPKAQWQNIADQMTGKC